MADRIQRFFDHRHSIEPSEVADVAAEELDRVREIASGRVASRYRSRAIGLLAVVGTPDAAALLREVLENPSEDPLARASAAGSLARLATPDLEPTLLRAIETTQHIGLRTRIANALGRLGTGYSVEMLRDLARGDEPALRRQATFALMLIGHRERRRDLTVPPPEEPLMPLTGRSLRFRIQPAGRDPELSRVRSFVAHDTFGISLAWELAFQAKCGPNVYFLLFNGADAPAELARTALDRPVLAGLLAIRAPEDGSYAVSRVIMVGPHPEHGAYIAIYRTDGTLVHWGYASVQGEDVDFHIESVSAPGNIAVDISGRVRGRTLEFAEGTTATRATATLAPKPFITPPTR